MREGGIVVISALVGTSLGLIFLMSVDKRSWRIDQKQGNSSLPSRDVGARSLSGVSIAERAAEQFNIELKDSGMVFSKGKSGNRLLQANGSFDEKVLKELGLNSEEEGKVRVLLQDAIGSVGTSMSSRLMQDPRRNISFGDEWETFYISGDPEGSKTVIDDLRKDLDLVCGENKAGKVFDSLNPKANFANFGRSEVFIQKRRDSDTGSFFANVEMFDPVTGMKLSETRVQNISDLKRLLGEKVALHIAP